MIDLINYSFSYLLMVLFFSALVHVVRTSPLIYSQIGLTRVGWRDWVADQLITRFGVERESLMARGMKLVSIISKYGFAAWSFRHLEELSLIFWILVWVTLLIVESMRKSAQFYIPAKWENVSLKLDSEHFWLINLVLLGVVELHIPGNRPLGLGSLVIFYIFLAGESKNTLLAALEDIVSTLLGIVALIFLFKINVTTLEDLAQLLFFSTISRAIIRTIFGRTWIKRKFWWIAQFCLMTSLIIKSMEVLNVWSLLSS